MAGIGAFRRKPEACRIICQQSLSFVQISTHAMSRQHIGKWNNMAPALLASGIDIMITIVHQPLAYWEGNLSQANEGNPIGALLMSQHIAGLFILSGLWIGLIIILGLYLHHKLLRYVILFVVIAHSYGAASWLAPRYGFWSAMALILLNTVVYLSTRSKAAPTWT